MHEHYVVLPPDFLTSGGGTVLEKFAQVKRSLLAEKVARNLIGLILEGNLQPGDKLPPERELAALLKVGRPALREALRGLHMMKIVETRHGDGTYISSLKPDLLIQPLQLFVTLGSLSMQHLLEVREILEIGVVRLAAQRISEGELDYLLECLSRAERVEHSAQEFVKADLDLHAAIVRAARNPLLTSIMRSIDELGRISREITGLLPEIRHEVLKDHACIVETLMQRDVEGSQRAMERHLRTVRKALQTTSHVLQQELKQKWGPAQKGGLS